MNAYSVTGPTVKFGRWGFLGVVVVVLALLAGCAGRRPVACDLPAVMPTVAGIDSLGLAEFLALAPQVKAERRSRAQSYVRAARAAARVDNRIMNLTAAAALAPDDPDYWLGLADTWRGLGDYLHTDACLENAAAAVSELGPESALWVARGAAYKGSVGLATALRRAWLHYDRAEWRDAVPWVRAALRAEPGNEAALQIRGLLAGALGSLGLAHEIANDLRRKDGFSTDVAWIIANLDQARGNDQEAFSNFLGLRPDERRVTECYRDMGRAAERVGEWSYAQNWYRESAAAVPHRKVLCLTKLQHTRVGDPATGPQLPFWLGRRTAYVTGSISAYLAYAFEQFEAAADRQDRQLWAGLVVNAAGICLRLDMEKPDAYRVRGLVFARTDRPERALQDLSAALKGAGEAHRYRALLEAEIGHVLLVQKRSGAATNYLRRSLARDDQQAQAWSDLGLALIMDGEQDAAEEALTRALTLDPGLAAAWYNRGLMHLHAGDLAQAEADLGQAALLAPSNMEVANLLQQVRQQKKKQGQP